MTGRFPKAVDVFHELPLTAEVGAAGFPQWNVWCENHYPRKTILYLSCSGLLTAVHDDGEMNFHHINLNK